MWCHKWLQEFLDTTGSVDQAFPVGLSATCVWRVPVLIALEIITGTIRSGAAEAPADVNLIAAAFSAVGLPAGCYSSKGRFFGRWIDTSRIVTRRLIGRRAPVVRRNG